MDEPVQIDQLYASFDKNLYRITEADSSTDTSNMLQASPSSTSGETMTVAGGGDSESGVDSSTSVQAVGSLQSGKKTFDNTVPGYILGFDPKDGKAKFYIGDTINYFSWDGSTLTVLGGVSVLSLDIPDTTSPNSFHVDTSGNTWWGANVASGITNANASITNAGAAVFKNIAVGGSAVQYVITNSGIFSYGDGSDGNATCDGTTAVAGMTLAGTTYTLTRDVYFQNLTVNTGITVTGQYRIFCSISCTVAGIIQNNGLAGGSGVEFGGPTSGGASLPAGYFLASAPGGSGGANNGTPGGSTINSLGGNGGSGGQGGNGSLSTHGNGAAGGTATPANVRLIANWHLATLLDINTSGATAKFTSGCGGGAGGVGGDLPSNHPQGSGGSAAGIVAIYAKLLTITSTGSITANAGLGGQGANSTSSDGGGGGGGGGAGGLIVLTYNQLSNLGSITANAGLGGSGGTASGNPGTNGGNGSAGSIYQFQLSL